jgi:hypothetical protein
MKKHTGIRCFLALVNCAMAIIGIALVVGTVWLIVTASAFPLENLIFQPRWAFAIVIALNLTIDYIFLPRIWRSVRYGDMRLPSAGSAGMIILAVLWAYFAKSQHPFLTDARDQTIVLLVTSVFTATATYFLVGRAST